MKATQTAGGRGYWRQKKMMKRCRARSQRRVPVGEEGEIPGRCLKGFAW